MNIPEVDRRRFIQATGVLGAAALLEACGSPSSSSSAAAGGAKSAHTGNGHYVEVSAFNSAPYFFDHKLGMDKAGEFLGVKTEFVGPDKFDVPAMVNTLEQKVAEGPSGLLIVGFDPTLEPGIQKAIQAGIPVVTVDADLPNSKRMCFLGTGNFQSGVLGGQHLSSLMPPNSKVLLIAIAGQTNLTDRVNGYQQALKAGGHTVVQVADDGGDPTKAAAAVTAALSTHPDLAGIGCVEAGGGTGAATALREAGKIGKVSIVSQDRDASTLQSIQKGEIQASVAQKTALMTFLGTLLLYQYQTFTLPITKDNAKANIVQLPNSVDTGAEIITQENVGAWTR